MHGETILLITTSHGLNTRVFKPRPDASTCCTQSSLKSTFLHLFELAWPTPDGSPGRQLQACTVLDFINESIFYGVTFPIPVPQGHCARQLRIMPESEIRVLRQETPRTWKQGCPTYSRLAPEVMPRVLHAAASVRPTR